MGREFQFASTKVIFEDWFQIGNESDDEIRRREDACEREIV
jgi:hypothetical protein